MDRVALTHSYAERDIGFESRGHGSKDGAQKANDDLQGKIESMYEDRGRMVRLHTVVPVYRESLDKRVS